MKEKFYEKTWFTILTLICVFPVGLILMWKNKKFNIPLGIACCIYPTINTKEAITKRIGFFRS